MTAHTSRSLCFCRDLCRWAWLLNRVIVATMRDVRIGCRWTSVCCTTCIAYTRPFLGSCLTIWLGSCRIRRPRVYLLASSTHSSRLWDHLSLRSSSYSLKQSLGLRALYSLRGLSWENGLRLAHWWTSMHRRLIRTLILHCSQSHSIHQVLTSHGRSSWILDDQHLLIDRCLSQVCGVSHRT